MAPVLVLADREMELRQLRYFPSVVEHGSMGKASLELGLVTSALSQQISRLEGELSTRLLQRSGARGHPDRDRGTQRRSRLHAGDDP
jgi:hypothetical protein